MDSAPAQHPRPQHHPDAAAAPHNRTLPPIAPGSSSAANPAPWQDYQTVFTNAKAGMEGVDKEHVQRVVYEMSKDSAHFRNEQRKQAQVAAKIERLKARSEALTASELAAATRCVDSRIAYLESTRDLTRTWLHADMDCFYAAVHELERPELKKVPMAVGGIGMISTANYVARRYGVRSAMPGFIAKRLCPQLVFAPLDFPRYTAMAERVRAVFRQLDPDFESGGLDEAHLDVTDYCARTGSSGAEAAAELRRRVREATGLTCSCGVAPNKMLAKICSDINKPDGQYVLPPSRAAIMSFLDTLPTRKIPCIGKVTEQLLRGVLGVSTCGQLLGPQRGRLPLLFTETAAGFFLEAALGLAATRHTPKTDTSLEPGRKGISCERTFRNMAAPAQQEAMARQLVESLAADMAAEELEGRNLTLKLKLSTFEVRTRTATLPRHVRSAEEMLPPVLRLLRAEMPVELRLMGVRMAALRKVNAAVRSPLARLLGLRPARPSASAGSHPPQLQQPQPQPQQHPASAQPLRKRDEAAQQPPRPGSAPLAHHASAVGRGCGGGFTSGRAPAPRTTEPGASPLRAPAVAAAATAEERAPQSQQLQLQQVPPPRGGRLSAAAAPQAGLSPEAVTPRGGSGGGGAGQGGVGGGYGVGAFDDCGEQWQRLGVGQGACGGGGGGCAGGGPSDRAAAWSGEAEEVRQAEEENEEGVCSADEELELELGLDGPPLSDLEADLDPDPESDPELNEGAGFFAEEQAQEAMAAEEATRAQAGWGGCGTVVRQEPCLLGAAGDDSRGDGVIREGRNPHAHARARAHDAVPDQPTAKRPRLGYERVDSLAGPAVNLPGTAPLAAGVGTAAAPTAGGAVSPTPAVSPADSAWACTHGAEGHTVGRASGVGGGGAAAAAGGAADPGGSGGCGGGHWGSWICLVCTYARNRRQVLRCEVCDCLRGSTKPPQQQQPPPRPSSSSSRPLPTDLVSPHNQRQQLQPHQEHHHHHHHPQLNHHTAPQPGKGRQGGSAGRTPGERPLQQLWAKAAAAGQLGAGSRTGKELETRRQGQAQQPQKQQDARRQGTGTGQQGQRQGPGQQGAGSAGCRCCPQCGATVAAGAWVEHQDWHLAVRLSREGTA